MAKIATPWMECDVTYVTSAGGARAAWPLTNKDMGNYVDLIDIEGGLPDAMMSWLLERKMGDIGIA